MHEALHLHRTWQGGKGSGLDVASCWHGGVIRFQNAQVESLSWPDNLGWQIVWSGISAATTDHIGHFDEWRKHADLSPLNRLSELSKTLCNDPSLELIKAYQGALMDLDNAAKLKIFSAEHRELVKIAADFGLVYKPCGAGGGDIGIAFADTKQPMVLDNFRNAATTAGFYCPTLEMVNMASDSPNNPGAKTTDLKTGSSRIANFFRMPVGERIAALHERGLLNSDDVHQLVSANHQLQVNVADKMIENVVGVFGLPMGVALNFLINNRDYVIPLVEEPSIVAGLSGAARLARLGGGFESAPVTPILIGQVQSVIEGDRGGDAGTVGPQRRHFVLSEQPASKNGGPRRWRDRYRSLPSPAEHDGQTDGRHAPIGGYSRCNGCQLR